MSKSTTSIGGKAAKGIATGVIKRSVSGIVAAPIAGPIVTVITIGCVAKSVWDLFSD